jgi:hypothetical protein
MLSRVDRLVIDAYRHLASRDGLTAAHDREIARNYSVEVFRFHFYRQATVNAEIANLLE